MGNSLLNPTAKPTTKVDSATSIPLTTFYAELDNSASLEGLKVDHHSVNPDLQNIAGDGEDEDENPLTENGSGLQSRRARVTIWYRRIKTALLTLTIVLFAILFAVNKEQDNFVTFVDLEDTPFIQWYNDSGGAYATITLSGPLSDFSYQNGSRSYNCSDFLFLCGPSTSEPDGCPSPDLNCESVLIHSAGTHKTVSRMLSTTPGFVVIEMSSAILLGEIITTFFIKFFTKYTEGVAFDFFVQQESISRGGKVALAFTILVLVYVLIGFEIVHRTVAALIGSTFVIAVLSMLNLRPSLETVVSWIDIETVCLLVGMMVLVGIFGKTGFFDYAAIKAYKVAQGREWPLIILLCSLTAFVSAFLDNVTTILLIVPVTIRLCQVLNLDPRPVLIAEVLFSNIGGTATAVGDPPNIIIVADSSIQEAGIGFAEFTGHMLIGIIPSILVAYILIVIMYTRCKHVKWKNNEGESRIEEFKRELRMWQRVYETLPCVSGEEEVIRDALKVKILALKRKLQVFRTQSVQEKREELKKTLYELEQKYTITDKVLLVKSFVVVVIVIIMFFLSSFIPNFPSLGWIAIFGAVTLIILSGIKDLEEVMHKIEWSTLIFFAGLFIMMKGLTLLELLSFIGDKLVQMIKLVPLENQNLVGIILILWVSAFVSAFIDNIPFVTAMIPVIVKLADSQDVCIDLKPMVFALAFGGCLGGNATLIGASANVVCAGIAEQSGYKISFTYFLKIGMPVMIATVFAAMVYLLIVHSGFGWNISPCTF